MMDMGQYLSFLLALIFVIGLIAGMAVVLRRFSPSARLAARLRPHRKRLAVVEAAPIDGRRTLVLVRRDETEHLLLLGHTHDLVVESGITPPADVAVAMKADVRPGVPALEKGSAVMGRLFGGKT